MKFLLWCILKMDFQFKKRNLQIQCHFGTTSLDDMTDNPPFNFDFQREYYNHSLCKV